MKALRSARTGQTVRLRPTTSFGGSASSAPRRCGCGSHSQVGPLRQSRLRPATCRLSDVVVTVWLSRAGSQPARNPPPALRNASDFSERSFASGEDVLDVTNRRRTAARHLAVCGDSEGHPSEPKCSSTPFIVSTSRRAHTSTRYLGNLGRRMSASWFPDSLPLHTLLGCERPAALPRALSGSLLARRHSRQGSGELGSLPCFVGCRAPGSRRVFRVAWGAARWRPRSIRPMSAAHGFSFQNDCPLRLGTLRIARPHAIRELSVHAARARFGGPTGRHWGVVFPKSRPAGVPLTPRRFAGFPAEHTSDPEVSLRSRDASVGAGPQNAALASFGSIPESLGLLRRCA